MAEHKHGDMDIDTHEKTFEGFMKFVVYTCMGIIVFLLFLAAVGG